MTAGYTEKAVVIFISGLSHASVSLNAVLHLSLNDASVSLYALLHLYVWISRSYVMVSIIRSRVYLLAMHY